MSTLSDFPYTPVSYETHMEALLKAFVVCTSQIDESTPLLFERDIPVGIIDEESNTFVLDMDKPAPELEVEQFSSTYHYHELYSSALLFPYEQLSDITPIYESLLAEFTDENGELPGTLQIVKNRIEGTEKTDHRENLLTVLRSGMLLDVRVTESMVEGKFESFPPIELNNLWGEAILNSEEASTMINDVFKQYELDFRSLAESLPDSTISGFWEVYQSVLSS